MLLILKLLSSFELLIESFGEILQLPLLFVCIYFFLFFNNFYQWIEASKV